MIYLIYRESGLPHIKHNEGVIRVVKRLTLRLDIARRLEKAWLYLSEMQKNVDIDYEVFMQSVYTTFDSIIGEDLFDIEGGATEFILYRDHIVYATDLTYSKHLLYSYRESDEDKDNPIAYDYTIPSIECKSEGGRVLHKEPTFPF